MSGIGLQFYGLSRSDWQHLTGAFTFGGCDSKAELDEIIRQVSVLTIDTVKRNSMKK